VDLWAGNSGTFFFSPSIEFPLPGELALSQGTTTRPQQKLIPEVLEGLTGIAH